MKGRKPKPTKLKILQGNPGGRPLNESEPQPEMDIECPIPPDYLDDGAKLEWGRMAPVFYNAGLLTKADIPAFEMYCMAYSKWLEAIDHIKKEGMVIDAPSGYPVQNPYLSIANKAYEQMKSILTEFGGTPGSRSRTIAKEPQKEKKKKGFASL